MSLVEFDPPRRFVVGTVGPPGERTFFLQASDERRRVQVAMEKVHAQALGSRMGQLLDQLAGEEGSVAAAAGVADPAPLDTPVAEDFRVEALSLAWDDERRAVVVEAHDHDPEESPDELHDDPARSTLRVVLSPPAARAFALRCETVVNAGRPSCPFCGGPLDPQGHICPRANGYRR